MKNANLQRKDIKVKKMRTKWSQKTLAYLQVYGPLLYDSSHSLSGPLPLKPSWNTGVAKNLGRRVFVVFLPGHPSGELRDIFNGLGSESNIRAPGKEDFDHFQGM